MESRFRKEGFVTFRQVLFFNVLCLLCQFWIVPKPYSFFFMGFVWGGAIFQLAALRNVRGGYKREAKEMEREWVFFQKLLSLDDSAKYKMLHQMEKSGMN